MNQKNIRTFLTIFLLILFFSCTSEQKHQTAEFTQQIQLPSDGLEITSVWARPGREGGTSAIYMSILNGSAKTDTLISLSSPAAGMVEVHETYEQEEGMMGMRPAETVVVPAKDSLTLKPGGLHVMMMRLNRELKEGDNVEFTVEFSNAGEISLTAPVQPMNR